MFVCSGREDEEADSMLAPNPSRYKTAHGKEAPSMAIPVGAHIHA